METKDLQTQFEIENQAKNNAYAFILSNNLLEEFAKFTRAQERNYTQDDCVEILIRNCFDDSLKNLLS